jgi:hypothetical protein
MFILQAPYPSMTATTILPNPNVGDTENLRNRIDIHRSMTGVRRVYVKDIGRNSLTFSFSILRPKALELTEFITAYNSVKWKIVTHENESWIVNLMNNPFEFTSIARSNPGRESLNIRFDFEGTRLL